MKIAFCCALSGALMFSAGASYAAKPSTAVAAKTNGFDLLMEAGQGYKRGPEGEPMSMQSMSVADNLANQRQSVSRNDKALKTLRQALQMPAIPTPITRRCASWRACSKRNGA
jgi:hypothetical protein